jgi:hypothetical protein
MPDVETSSHILLQRWIGIKQNSNDAEYYYHPFGV